MATTTAVTSLGMSKSSCEGPSSECALIVAELVGYDEITSTP